MKDLHAIAQERQVVEAEIKSLRTQISNNEQLLADKRKRLEDELQKLADLRVAANAVFDRTEVIGLPEPVPMSPDALESAQAEAARVVECGPNHGRAIYGNGDKVYCQDCGGEYVPQYNSIFTEPADFQAQALQNGAERIEQAFNEATR